MITLFNYSFVIPATVNRVPCVYVEGRNVYNGDTADTIFVSYKEPHPQLYNLQADPGETNNVAEQHAELVQQLQVTLKNIQTATHSTGK